MHNAPGDGYVIGWDDTNTRMEWVQQAATATVNANAPITGDGSAGNPLDIAAGGIDTAELADAAVTQQKITTSAVSTGKLQTGAVTNVKIANNAVRAAQIQNNAVTNAKLANDAVDTAEIANDAVTQAKIAANAVGQGELANDAVITARIEDNAVSEPKLQMNNAPNDGQVISWDGPNSRMEWVTPSTGGTVFTWRYGATAPADVLGSIGDWYLRTTTGATHEKAAAATVAATGVLTLTAVPEDGSQLDIMGPTLTAGYLFGPGSAIDTTSNDLDTIATNTAGQLNTHLDITAVRNGQTVEIIASLPGSAGNSINISAQGNTHITGLGDLTGGVDAWPVRYTSLLDIANAVREANLAADAVTSAKIAATAVTTGKLANNAVTTAKIDGGAVTEAKIASGAVTGSKMGTGSVSGNTISDGGVTAGKYSAGSVSTNALANTSVTNAKLRDGAVTNAKIASNVIHANKLEATNTPAAGQVPSYDGSTGFTWVANAAGGGFALLSGSGAPNDADGSDGDWYVQTGSGQLYQKATGTWGTAVIDFLRDAAGEVATSNIADAAVNTAKLADSAVESGNIANGAVNRNKILDGAVNTATIANDAVTGAKVASNLRLVESGDTIALELVTSSNNTEPALRIQTNNSGDQKAFQARRQGQSLAWASFEGTLGGSSARPGIALGPGTGSRDTELYRAGADHLLTPDAFSCDELRVTGTAGDDAAPTSDSARSPRWTRCRMTR